ncbi:MAG: nucleoid-structuring protein H-NS [Verrucomicrobia bacterium]|nr:aldolase catalytic domain-containing protein [Kiritimatiellia bacterium]MCB1102304.1 aldolase catalytic domain-containing protein [Kiritimatiellia bacterium]MCP5487657.1 nucleoid-structuring protein H-NS [Verrucomicrobiota bacterium]
MSTKAPWITYRPELKVLDCTIRDGGLVNDSNFTDDQVKAVYAACVESGVDYMEIGYMNSTEAFPTDQYGPWRHCEESALRRVVGDHDAEKTGLKLAVMIDAGGKSDWQTALLPKADSVISLVRVACYANQISEAVEMLQHADELGYETSLNIMAISTVKEVEIDQVLKIARDTPADVVVVVDSNGALYREQVDHLVRKYMKALQGTGKDVGMHAHNNLQLAFANTLEAIILGCNRVDSTMMGLGRGAGNCNTEYLLSFLRNPKFKLRPVLECIQNTILPLRQELDWGPSIPYMITGQLNAHPRSAIAFREGETPDDFVGFYDQMVTES